MTRSRPDEEVDVADQFLNYDGEVTMTVEAEGTSVDNPEHDTSTTDKIENQQQIIMPMEESQKSEDPSDEKENKDPNEKKGPEEEEEVTVQEQTNGNEKSDEKSDEKSGEKSDEKSNEKSDEKSDEKNDEKSDEKSDNDSDDSEEVYEVEAVLDHNKKRNKTYYLIKWKGYSEEESTWEAEDNVFAQDLVDEYWQRLNAEETKTKETRKGRKRTAAAPPPTPTKKESKRVRINTPKRAKSTRAKIDDEFDHDEDWESLVSGVETVTRDDKTGELLVYLKWKNGDTSRHPAREANLKCPQKMIRFYEQRLTFAAPQSKS